MITLNDILLILGMHAIFDWWLQTRWQAENKSKDIEALLSHVGVYTLGLFCVGCFLFTSYDLLMCWAIVNSALHFGTDFITSRLNAKFYPNKSFWNCIGADQFIHYATLFYTYDLIR